MLPTPIARPRPAIGERRSAVLLVSAMWVISPIAGDRYGRRYSGANARDAEQCLISRGMAYRFGYLRSATAKRRR